jgi:hypothetical protein
MEKYRFEEITVQLHRLVKKVHVSVAFKAAVRLGLADQANKREPRQQ